MSYTIKGTQEVEVNIDKSEVYYIIQKEYFNLLGNSNFYRKDNKVFLYYIEDCEVRELTEKELSYAIALETTLEYFEKIIQEKEEE